MKICSLGMGSVDLECHGCCQKRVLVQRNRCLWVWCLWRTLPKCLAASFIWSWIDLNFHFVYIPFHFLQNLSHSFISLLRNDSLLPTSAKLATFAGWFVEGPLNLTHPAPPVLLSSLSSTGLIRIKAVRLCRGCSRSDSFIIWGPRK